MTGIADDLDRVGAAYLEHLTDADLRALVRAERVSDEDADRRIHALRRAPSLVPEVLDRPDTSARLLHLAGDPSGRQFTFISPFLLFAAAVHRTAADLAAHPYAPERTAPRLRVPVFDSAELIAYLATPYHRLFLAELLASFARASSGFTVVDTPHGPRRRRWSDTDPARLAVLLESVPAPQRPGVWRRLGDLALFLGGVFPDAAERTAPDHEQALRLARRTGVAEEPGSQLGAADLLEWLGSRWYLLAADNAVIRTDASALLRQHAEHFHHARRVLNAATDRYLFPITAEWFAPPR
jgi:hypothetical protein